MPLWGGIGCAIAISGSLLVGQGIIMNIYYRVKQGIDIKRFWKEITKMNFAPFLLTLAFVYTMRNIIVGSWSKLALWICIYTLIYVVLLYKISMNQYERDLFTGSIKKILNR